MKKKIEEKADKMRCPACGAEINGVEITLQVRDVPFGRVYIATAICPVCREILAVSVEVESETRPLSAIR